MPEAGNGSGASVGFEPSSISEAGAVITDLRQQACAGEVAQAREPGDDRDIGVLAELGSNGLGEGVSSLAGRLQLGKQGQGLVAQALLDQGQLVQPPATEDQVEALDLDFDITLATAPDECGAQLGAGQRMWHFASCYASSRHWRGRCTDSSATSGGTVT